VACKPPWDAAKSWPLVLNTKLPVTLDLFCKALETIRTGKLLELLAQEATRTFKKSLPDSLKTPVPLVCTWHRISTIANATVEMSVLHILDYIIIFGIQQLFIQGFSNASGLTAEK